MFAHVQNVNAPSRAVKRVGNPILPSVQTELPTAFQTLMSDAVRVGTQPTDFIENVLRNGWREVFKLTHRCR